jgi:hypothetical protein
MIGFMYKVYNYIHRGFHVQVICICIERSGTMITHINLDNIENQNQIINKFFKKEHKVSYNKKLSGKVKLYISEKNTLRSIKGLVMLYKRELQ